MELIAIILASVVSMAIGMLWYSPVLFGKQWMKGVGLTQEQVEESKKKHGMGKTMSLAFIFTLITAFVISTAAGTSLSGGDLYAAVFVLWLGFVVPVMANGSLWEGKPWSLFLINAGYQLVALMGMVLVFNLLI